MASMLGRPNRRRVFALVDKSRLAAKSNLRWGIAKKKPIVDVAMRENRSRRETLVLFPVYFFAWPLSAEESRPKPFRCFLRIRGNFVGTSEPEKSSSENASRGNVA